MKRALLPICVLAAACGPPGDGAPPSAAGSPGVQVLDEAAVARGRSERAFWAKYDAARVALAAGNVDAARVEFIAALAQKPDHAASLYALAGIEHRAGRHADAIAYCDRLLEFDRPRTRALLLRATIASDVEAVLGSGAPAPPWFDLRGAEDDAAAAEAINPEETGPHLARAKIALLRGDLDTATSSLGRALTIHPDHAEALVLRVVIARRRRDSASARAATIAALAATKPTVQLLPAGEGDTSASLAADPALTVSRLRALASAIGCPDVPWPPEAPHCPPLVRFPAIAIAETSDPLRVVGEFGGAGGGEYEIVARRAPEDAALRSLFGARDARRDSFVLRRSGVDVTSTSGLAGVAAAVARLVATDHDGDGRVDVLVLPGHGDPQRVEPPLLLRNEGAGRFSVSVIDPLSVPR